MQLLLAAKLITEQRDRVRAGNPAQNASCVEEA